MEFVTIMDEMVNKVVLQAGLEETKEETKEETVTVFTLPLLLPLPLLKPTIPHLDLTESLNWIIDEKYTNVNFTRSRNYYRNLHPLKGPTEESNWLIKKTPGFVFGSFAVGGYPDKSGFLPSLLADGLNTFVCLNSEYGKQVKNHNYTAYADNNSRIPKGRFILEPIDDMKTVDDKTIDVLSTDIVTRITNGENVYLHCAGGHGRTGTVAALVLYKLYPHLTVPEIFDYLQFAHDQRSGNYFGPQMFTSKMKDDPLAKYFVIGQVPTPQTSTQRCQVRRIIAKYTLI